MLNRAAPVRDDRWRVEREVTARFIFVNVVCRERRRGESAKTLVVTGYSYLSLILRLRVESSHRSRGICASQGVREIGESRWVTRVFLSASYGKEVCGKVWKYGSKGSRGPTAVMGV